MPRLPKDIHLWGWLGKTYWNQSPPFANNAADLTMLKVKKLTTKKEKKTHTTKEYPKKRICQFCGISFPSKTKMLHCVISHLRKTNSNQKFYHSKSVRETANSRHLTSPSPNNSHSSTHPYTETIMSLTLGSGHGSFASGSHDVCIANVLSAASATPEVTVGRLSVESCWKDLLSSRPFFDASGEGLEEHVTSIFAPEVRVKNGAMFAQATVDLALGRSRGWTEPTGASSMGNVHPK